jgi:putative RecB family exonuclease
MEKIKDLCLSVSKAKTFEQCPRKYFYHYIEHLPSKKWPHFALGLYAHKALELFHSRLLENSEVNLRQLMGTCCRDAYSYMIESGETLDQGQVDEVKAMFIIYLRKLDLNMPSVISTEKSFTISLSDNYDLTGVIDRIDQEDEIIHIRDYKTSKNERYMDSFQLNTYGLYLKEKYPNTDKFKASYIMLKLDSKIISYSFTDGDVETCRNHLIRLADKITKEERWLAKPSKLCDWCDFQSTCQNSWL